MQAKQALLTATNISLVSILLAITHCKRECANHLDSKQQQLNNCQVK